MSWERLSPLVRYHAYEGDDMITLRLAGELDVSSSQLVGLIEQAGREASRVVLDLRRVSFSDAYGLSLLLAGDRRVRDQGGELVLRQPHRAVRRLLQLSGNEVGLTVEEPAAFLAPTSDVVAILSEAVEVAMGVSRATTGHVRLADASGALHYVTERNTPREILDYFEVVDSADSADSASGAAWAVKNAVNVPDITRSPIYLGTPSLEIVRDGGIRSVGSIPLWSLEGHPLGTLSLGSDRTGEWSLEQRRELWALATATGRLLTQQAS